MTGGVDEGLPYHLIGVLETTGPQVVFSLCPVIQGGWGSPLSGFDPATCRPKVKAQPVQRLGPCVIWFLFSLPCPMKSDLL